MLLYLDDSFIFLLASAVLSVTKRNCQETPVLLLANIHFYWKAQASWKEIKFNFTQFIELVHLEVRVFFHTSRHFLHEDLDEPILTFRAQVLHNVLVF